MLVLYVLGCVDLKVFFVSMLVAVLVSVFESVLVSVFVCLMLTNVSVI